VITRQEINYKRYEKHVSSLLSMTGGRYSPQTTTLPYVPYLLLFLTATPHKVPAFPTFHTCCFPCPLIPPPHARCSQNPLLQLILPCICPPLPLFITQTHPYICPLLPKTYPRVKSTHSYAHYSQTSAAPNHQPVPTTLMAHVYAYSSQYPLLIISTVQYLPKPIHVPPLASPRDAPCKYTPDTK
jgi:hypothetical protein